MRKILDLSLDNVGDVAVHYDPEARPQDRIISVFQAGQDIITELSDEEMNDIHQAINAEEEDDFIEDDGDVEDF